MTFNIRPGTIGAIFLGTINLTQVWFATRGTREPKQYREDLLFDDLSLHALTRVCAARPNAFQINWSDLR